MQQWEFWKSFLGDLERWQKGVMTWVTPESCSMYGGLFYVEHLSSTATDCSSGTQRSKCTSWVEPNTQSLPGNQGVNPNTAPRPALGNVTGSEKWLHWLQPRCSAMSCQVPRVYRHKKKTPLLPKKLHEISFDEVFWKIVFNISLVFWARETRDLQKFQLNVKGKTEWEKRMEERRFS